MDPVCHRCHHWSPRRTLCRTRVRDLPDALPIDYDSGLPAVSSDLYYHTADEEKLHMSPIGLNLADIDSETSSRTSTNWDNFHGDVEDRDKSCVLTGDPSYVCNAMHLIPDSQGRYVTFCMALSLLTLSSLAVHRSVFHAPTSRSLRRRRHSTRY